MIEAILPQDNTAVMKVIFLQADYFFSIKGTPSNKDLYFWLFKSIINDGNSRRETIGPNH
jgi:hypothetical protein